jgi:hypothetical protein
MNLIDCSYFYTGPLAIMNARKTGDLDNNADEVQECITGYIVEYQQEFLDLMVGAALRRTIESYLAWKDESRDNVDEALEELCEQLRKSFAQYVYFKLAGDVNQNMTVTGLMLLKSANTNQPPRKRMVKVWNDMVKLNVNFVEWAEASDYEVYYDVEMVTPINQFNL